MKLSVNEAKLTGLCSRNCYSTGFEFKQFALGPEKFLELSRNEPGPGPVDVDEISDQHTELGLVDLVSPACMAEAKTREREKEKSTQRKRESRGEEAPAIRASVVFHAGALLY